LTFLVLFLLFLNFYSLIFFFINHFQLSIEPFYNKLSKLQMEFFFQTWKKYNSIARTLFWAHYFYLQKSLEMFFFWFFFFSNYITFVEVSCQSIISLQFFSYFIIFILLKKNSPNRFIGWSYQNSSIFNE